MGKPSCSLCSDQRTAIQEIDDIQYEMPCPRCRTADFVLQVKRRSKPVMKARGYSAPMNYRVNYIEIRELGVKGTGWEASAFHRGPRWGTVADRICVGAALSDSPVGAVLKVLEKLKVEDA